MVENGTPVPELLEILGLVALTPVRMLAPTSVPRTVRSFKLELEVVGISRAVGKFSKLALLLALLNADTT